MGGICMQASWQTNAHQPLGTNRESKAMTTSFDDIPTLVCKLNLLMFTLNSEILNKLLTRQGYRHNENATQNLGLAGLAITFRKGPRAQQDFSGRTQKLKDSSRQHEAPPYSITRSGI
jgi:hypothetical protein